MDLDSLSRTRTTESSDVGVYDTPASSVNGSDGEAEEENEEEQEEEEEAEVPLVTLHQNVGYNVDAVFECPLKALIEHTLGDAQRSASQGCPGCILRIAASSEILPDLPASAQILCSHNYIFSPFRVQGHRIVMASNTQRTGKDHIMSNFYGDKIGCRSDVERVLSCDTASSESLETAKGWINNCNTEHDCIKKVTPNLPRRLLDVRNNTVRLHETTLHDRGTRYACLSHCWGKPPKPNDPFKTVLRTTPATLYAFRTSIPWNDLPQTFQDAIAVTRKLDIPFLWIDSLCIIQDEPDKKDWHEQSANMANVYQNSYLTLAATSAKDADGGMYTQHDGPRVHRPSAPVAVVQYEDGVQREIFARRKFDHDLGSLPLLKRGWVYQERLLSPRVLHFAGEELIWECNQEVACECGSDDLENGIVDRVRIHDDEYVVVGPNSGHPTPLDLWYKIVSDFTSLSLTKISDVFPALSGIAKVFAEKIGDEYVAGMWKGRIVSNLLWYFQEVPEDDENIQEEQTEEEDDKAEKTEIQVQPWRAPSWSWASASFTSKTRFLPVTKELANVRDIVCKPSGADPTGELETARLTLTTKALPAHLDSAGMICLADALELQELPRSYSHHQFTLETGYLNLDTAVAIDILFAQLTTCTGEQKVHLHNVYADIHITQEVRSYLLLARRADGWVRVGIAAIAEYEPDKTVFARAKREYRQDMLKHKTREEVVAIVEQQAERNRSVFRMFDESETQDLVVW
ncbi:hypothetical protein HBI56_185780 [Parastagonospora nodorum]|uniref:Heterokaryon incompatibility domain-containing protein n=1 Tax=Phaeosphaeria nodorum (strain SN15 / ATCC MYA-4574 / FGSC 10173) TaxID=321614 RepID=A0A7U2IAY6_PHANO|nr:hypothetical protein HBH56_163800 [Parastagonospora nodorum]QRD06522.1 hypothetical protein JI435_118890 [Parastagonospora nodorum SN15]KAH3931706.1 hypothetical protein HBH54_085440 [Parastagonospora nodorum]KAH3972768.1 hypothetical protein HBH51_099980 [Parastagonospora nodorum]KAH4020702.1 hypothetical protein HBI09_178840 [Parastagonospora nodorum]